MDIFNFSIDEELFDLRQNELADEYANNWDENDPEDEKRFYTDRERKIFAEGFKSGYYMGAADILEKGFKIKSLKTTAGRWFL